MVSDYDTRMTNEHAKNVAASAAKIQAALVGKSAKFALILGSGLGGFADKLSNVTKISYADLPGFPILTVAGHKGELLIGEIEGKTLIALNGRKHLYETNDFYPLKTMIRSLKAAGVENLFITSATGSLDTNIPAGEVMAVTDHINLMGINPLIGPNDDDFGPRFMDMNNAWSPELREKLLATAKAQDIPLHQGVFVGFRGPNFETPAEIKLAQMVGGTAVGMSSVPDCLLARHCGLNVMGCAVMTNLGAGLSDEVLSHDHTLEGAKLAAEKMEKLVYHFISEHG